jgi:hydroxymethylbilane synthase
MNRPPALPLRLGTRGSPLALAQADLTKAALIAKHGLDPADILIVPVKTTGDKVQDRPLAEIGGKALWTKELDRALAAGDIDFAVHSMKDVETIRPAEIAIAAILPRADVRDRLIGAQTVEDLPKDARIGTSSPRRAAQMLALRPDCRIETLRGNVATRLAAVEIGTVDATLLAAAGLDRLGHSEIGAAIATETLLPAAQQGAIGIETLAENTEIRAFFRPLDDPASARCIAAERAFLFALGADCHSPVAALAEIADDAMTLRAQILMPDGSEAITRTAGAHAGDDPEKIAQDLAVALFDAASPALRAPFAW